MVVSDRTKGCCSSDLNEPPHPNHDQFAELDAHNCGSRTQGSDGDSMAARLRLLPLLLRDRSATAPISGCSHLSCTVPLHNIGTSDCCGAFPGPIARGQVAVDRDRAAESRGI